MFSAKSLGYLLVSVPWLINAPMFLHPRFRKKNNGAKKQAVEDAWKSSREREAVLAKMSKSERKRRRYE